MPHRTAEGRATVAAIAAHESWVQTEDRTKRTAKARGTFDARFLKEANGDPELAAQLRSDYFRKIAAKSAEARRANKKTKTATGDNAARAADLRKDLAASTHRRVQFLLDRISEDAAKSGDLTRDIRRDDEQAARRELVTRLGLERRHDLLRILLTPYRDYPDADAEWFM